MSSAGLLARFRQFFRGSGNLMNLYQENGAESRRAHGTRVAQTPGERGEEIGGPPFPTCSVGTAVSRRFLRVCTYAAAAVGLGPLAAKRFVEAAERGARPSVIWLQFQECTGCTESRLRTAHPADDDLIFDLISLDDHETLFAAAGHQSEAALKQAMHANRGKYVCVVEGAIPIREDGIYCMIGGRTASGRAL